MNVKNETIESAPGNSYSSSNPIVFLTLLIWFGIVLFLGSQQAFVQRPGSPPLNLFLGLATPLVIFFTTYFASGVFRSFIRTTDLRLVAAIQGWRWAGLGFLFLFSKGILPGLFAFPAGVGDMAIGISAPWIVLGLIRNPQFAGSRRFVTWNILGILDLVVAVSMGVLCSGLVPSISKLTGNITSAPMSQLPLVLIPTYLVPFFIMLHFTALVQARRFVRANASTLNG